jgi:hypothetical protein
MAIRLKRSTRLQRNYRRNQIIQNYFSQGFDFSVKPFFISILNYLFYEFMLVYSLIAQAASISFHDTSYFDHDPI